MSDDCCFESHRYVYDGDVECVYRFNEAFSEHNFSKAEGLLRGCGSVQEFVKDDEDHHLPLFQQALCGDAWTLALGLLQAGVSPIEANRNHMSNPVFALCFAPPCVFEEVYALSASIKHFEIWRKAPDLYNNPYFQAALWDGWTEYAPEIYNYGNEVEERVEWRLCNLRTVMTHECPDLDYLEDALGLAETEAALWTGLKVVSAVTDYLQECICQAKRWSVMQRSWVGAVVKQSRISQ